MSHLETDAFFSQDAPFQTTVRTSFAADTCHTSGFLKQYNQEASVRLFIEICSKAVEIKNKKAVEIKNKKIYVIGWCLIWCHKLFR